MYRSNNGVAATLDAPARDAENNGGAPARSVAGDPGRRHDSRTRQPAAARAPAAVGIADAGGID
jgi:hypothetical protein